MEHAPAISASDGPLAETSSEKEPTEPKTPVDVTDVQESTDTTETPSVDEAKPSNNEPDLEKGEDGARMAVN